MILLPGPGSLALTGADFLAQEPMVESPLPGGIATVVRFLFQTVPQWVQVAGLFVGLAVAAWVAVLLWRRRSALAQWVATRPRGVRVGLAAGAAAAVLAFTAFGAVSWNYMQYDNGFCTGCHVMGPAYQRFVASEHDSLSCHDCHQQSIFASTRQLYLWVAERPAEIGPHAKVPNDVCARCHVTDRAEVWQRIASTAGHRTHLESDSSSLRGLQCVTCHGLEVHHFAPVDSTCGQAGCHVGSAIGLGKMRQQTALHCVTCHQFTAEVPRLATRDSATGTLVPGQKQCFSCHEMRAVLAGFDPARDPHSGTCGMCHNPHTQRAAAAAAKSCTTAGCHADWRAEPFHVGLQHRKAGERCTLCHQPHQASVDASDCAGCHAAVRERARGRLSPPLPFDTTAALRRTSLRHDWWTESHVKGKGDPPLDDPPRAPLRLAAPAALPDSFSHDRHKQLACLTCHVSRSGHGRLTFAPPRGCQICHHQAPATSDCATCHVATELARPLPVTVRVAVAGTPPASRSATFEHARHAGLKCVTCHTVPVTLAPVPAAASCAACHDGHHDAGRSCAACHDGVGAAVRAAHAPPVEAHLGCASCHAPAIVARLTPDRLLCLTCHPSQGAHQPTRECSVCHLQATPDALRERLQRTVEGS